MGRRIKFRAAAIPGAFAEDAEFLVNDVRVGAFFDGGSTKVLITIQITSAVKIQITKDGGTTWGYLNSGIALVAGALMEFGIRCKHADDINLRTDDAAGVTVNVCEVHEDLT